MRLVFDRRQCYPLDMCKTLRQRRRKPVILYIVGGLIVLAVGKAMLKHIQIDFPLARTSEAKLPHWMDERRMDDGSPQCTPYLSWT